jgi:hypothetical protein
MTGIVAVRPADATAAVAEGLKSGLPLVAATWANRGSAMF